MENWVTYLIGLIATVIQIKFNCISCFLHVTGLMTPFFSQSLQKRVVDKVITIISPNKSYIYQKNMFGFGLLCFVSHEIEGRKHECIC